MLEDGSTISTGLAGLDELIQGLHMGDNVVWQVDRLDDYMFFARAFAAQAAREGVECIYLRFAPHSCILESGPGVTCLQVDPAPGFDAFSSQIHGIIDERGSRAWYVFDNISALVAEWRTDESLANFFQLTCPRVLAVGAIAYFALSRGQHAQRTVSRIRDTTQVLVDLFHVGADVYAHPQKLWGRYSPNMFLPHRISGTKWTPIVVSGDAAAVLANARKQPIGALPGVVAPWDSVYQKLMLYHGEDTLERREEMKALKRELASMIIGNHAHLNDLADWYLGVSDLLEIRNRLIGSGRIGGKSAGMLLARAVLERESGEFDFSQVLEEHDSFYIGSDVFFTFLVENGLYQLRLDLSRRTTLSKEEFATVEERFLAGSFQRETVEQFRDMLGYYGQAPIIVRSSSLLEDGYTDAFAGKYRSEFCANQGSPENRLEAFMRAVKLVYASALNPDALSYRRKRGLGEGDEQMAILVQRVSGMPYRDFFFPTLAGVAFSRNLYAWSDRINPRQGLIRLVFGLGTRAVDRVGSDYPRMIAVSHPEIRPEFGRRVAKYSQREMDLLDLKGNSMITAPVHSVVRESAYPNLDLIISLMVDDHVHEPLVLSPSVPEGMVVTFNKLIKDTAFLRTMAHMLRILERVWGQPVDTEFTAHIDHQRKIRVNLLQCRSLRLPRPQSGQPVLPDNLPPGRLLFRAGAAISAGGISGITHVVFIDPEAYGELPDTEKKSVGRAVGKLNSILQDLKTITMAIGPGRWGSNNIRLGVNVTYADIDGISVLVEIPREETVARLEVSYGTHFFQDIVESGMFYVPVHPGERNNMFNSGFFLHSPNSLGDLLPEFTRLAGALRVISIPAVANGATACLVVDPDRRLSVCFLQ